MRRCLHSDPIDPYGEEMDGPLAGVAERLNLNISQPLGGTGNLPVLAGTSPPRRSTRHWSLDIPVWLRGLALRQRRIDERQRRAPYQPSPTGWVLSRPIPKR